MEDLTRVLSLDAATLEFRPELNLKSNSTAVHSKYKLPPSWKRVRKSLNHRRRSQSSIQSFAPPDESSLEDFFDSDVASTGLTNTKSEIRGRSCGAPSPSPGPVVVKEEINDEEQLALDESEFPTNSPEAGREPFQARPLPPLAPERRLVPFVEIPVRSSKKRQLIRAGTESSDEGETVTLTGPCSLSTDQERPRRPPMKQIHRIHSVSFSSSSQINSRPKRRRTSPSTSQPRTCSTL